MNMEGFFLTLALVVAASVIACLTGWLISRWFRGEMIELGGAVGDLRTGLVEVRTEVSGLRIELRQDVGSLRSEISGLRTELHQEIGSLHMEMKAGFASVTEELKKLNARTSQLP
jgi:hypothetical protein